MDDLIAKLDLLSKQLKGEVAMCEYCGGEHASIECQVCYPPAQPQYEETYLMENYNWQNDPYSCNYNQDWRNHPNFSWNGPYNTVNPSIMNPMNQEMNQWPYQPPGFQPRNQAQEPKKKRDLEIALESLVNETRDFVARTDARIKRMDAANNNLEIRLNTSDQDFYEPPMEFQHPSPPQSNKDSLEEAMVELSMEVLQEDEERSALQRYVDEQMELLLNSSNSKPHDALPSNIETYPEEDEGFATLQDGNKKIEVQMEEPIEEKVEEPIEEIENQWPNPIEEKPNMEVFPAFNLVDPQIEEPIGEKVEEEIEPLENKLPGPFEETQIMEIFQAHNPIDPFEEYLVRIADSDKQKISKYLSASPQIFIKGKLEESEKGVAQRVTYVEQSHLMKLKPLPTHVRYVFLGASYETARMFKEQYLNNLVDPD